MPYLPPKPPVSADGEVAVPPRLQEQFRGITGADVSNVVVHRGAAAAADAARLGAASFAQGEVVALPASAGPLSDDRARGLLAHELTHVVQQRRLRGEVPVESSAAGQALEREAQSVERHIRDEHVAPRPTVAPSPPPEAPKLEGGPALSAEDHQAIVAAANRMVADGRATSDGHGGLVFDFADSDARPRAHAGRDESAPAAIQPLAASAGGPAGTASAAPLQPPPTATAARVQRAEAPAAPLPAPSSADGDLDTPPAGPAIHPTFSRPALPSRPAMPAGGLGVDAWPSAQPTPQTPSPAPSRPPAESSLVTESPVSIESQPSTDSQPPPETAASQPPQIDLDDLAKRLYDKVRRQIKTELLIERERVGLIADLR